MANTKSARKAVRQTVRKTFVNRVRRGRMRVSLKSVETALSSGDSASAKDALRNAESTMARAAKNGFVHRNTAARRISSLARRLKLLETNV